MLHKNIFNSTGIKSYYKNYKENYYLAKLWVVKQHTFPNYVCHRQSWQNCKINNKSQHGKFASFDKRVNSLPQIQQHFIFQTNIYLVYQICFLLLSYFGRLRWRESIVRWQKGQNWQYRSRRMQNMSPKIVKICLAIWRNVHKETLALIKIKLILCLK